MYTPVVRFSLCKTVHFRYAVLCPIGKTFVIKKEEKKRERKKNKQKNGAKTIFRSPVSFMCMWSLKLSLPQMLKWHADLRCGDSGLVVTGEVRG